MAGVPKIKGAKKIAKTEVVPFTRQLASMIGAGMPILSTIQTLEEQCSNPEFKKVKMDGVDKAPPNASWDRK